VAVGLLQSSHAKLLVRQCELSSHLPGRRFISGSKLDSSLGLMQSYGNVYTVTTRSNIHHVSTIYVHEAYISSAIFFPDDLFSFPTLPSQRVPNVYVHVVHVILVA
jgi:hypothetical protein